MVQQQLLKACAATFILLCGNVLHPQEQPPPAPGQGTSPDRGPGAPPGKGPGPHGFGFFKRPPHSPGQSPGSPDHTRNWMADRALMLLLMEASPADLETQLARWPRFKQMSDAEKMNFRKRLEGFRKVRRQAALHAAKQMGLQIRPDQEEAFLGDFWKGRRKIEETLFREMEPRRRDLESQFREEISSRYAPGPQ